MIALNLELHGNCPPRVGLGVRRSGSAGKTELV
jgi:hypothetical protein